jgi:putative endonuclease
LYTGVTNHLVRRIQEHRDGLVPGFASPYRIHRLVYFEMFRDVRGAIAREKEIKAWRREKKVALIEERNPTWEDLAARFSLGTQEKQIPHFVRDDGLMKRSEWSEVVMAAKLNFWSSSVVTCHSER